MKKQKGFSLIELLIVVAIILIIAAIAIPNLIRSRMAANEASAVASSRTLNTSEVLYTSSFSAVGYSALLADLGGTAAQCAPGVAPTATSACLIDQVLASGTKSGYTFVYTPTAANGVNASYTFASTPTALGSTGQRGFFTDQSGVIRGDVSGVATVASAPLQ